MGRPESKNQRVTLLALYQGVMCRGVWLWLNIGCLVPMCCVYIFVHKEYVSIRIYYIYYINAYIIPIFM